MASYQTVISNDTLTHKALPGSPETLCGKLVVDRVPAYEDSKDSDGYLAGTLPCDICGTLGDGGNFLKENVAKITEAGRDCPQCKDGFDASGNLCEDCGGTGWLSEGDDDPYSELSGINVDDLHGTRVASEGDDACEDCGNTGVPLVKRGSVWKCVGCATVPTTTNWGVKSSWKSVEKSATNWTRDGVAIENGFEVIIDKEQASRTPFLDYTRVAVSEKHECPDCHDGVWVSKVAGCDTCGLIKCQSCMESIGASTFFGMCKRCASTESDFAIEADYEDAYPDLDRYHAYLLTEDDGEPDPLFLPSDPN